MRGTIVGLLVTTALLGACSNPDLEKRVAELEKWKAENEEKMKAAPGAAAAKMAPPMNEEEEKAAAELLKQASQAAEAMRYDEAKAKVAELKEKYGATRAARAAQRIEQELEIVGKPAMAINAEKWFQGNADTSSGTHLLVFWEVWCPHCKKEVPKLEATYAKYGSRGFNIVGVTKMTRDITEQQVTDFITEQKVTYPVAKEKGDETSTYYGVKGIPAAAVVKDGKVVWRGHPARITDQMIEGWISG